MAGKNTIQKKVIYEVISHSQDHPTAEEVYKEVKLKIPSISLATVYRVLNTFYHEGKINRIEINREYHYDAYIKDHAHFVCSSCGKIYDLEFEKDKMVVAGVIMDGFNVERIEVIFTGVCKECLLNR